MIWALYVSGVEEGEETWDRREVVRFQGSGEVGSQTVLGGLGGSSNCEVRGAFSEEVAAFSSAWSVRLARSLKFSSVRI